MLHLYKFSGAKSNYMSIMLVKLNTIALDIQGLMNG